MAQAFLNMATGISRQQELTELQVPRSWAGGPLSPGHPGVAGT